MFFSSVPSVSLDEIKPSDFVIDVREPYEFKEGHLPNAKNVPLDTVGNFKTDKKVFVICASGMRSKAAVKILRKNGIDAINIKGGMMAYGR